MMNILVGVDGSECSEVAIQEIVRTQAKGTNVKILHVIEPLPAIESWAYAADYRSTLGAQRKEAEAFVAQAAEILRNAGFVVTTAIEEGVAKSILVDTAFQWPADLVVLGSHGRKGLARFLLGSVSEGVVRHAPCSVLIVRSRPSK
jgi:nucleotide-binding universal stress UspA family protein